MSIGRSPSTQGGSAALSCGKALPFRLTARQFQVLRRGYASPVEAQPQPGNKISPRKGEAFPQDVAAQPLTLIGYNNRRNRRSEI